MKRLYTFLFVLLCTITASAEMRYYLVSDSIFEAKKYSIAEYEQPDGTTISMRGFDRKLVDEEGVIPLTGKWQYIQITDKPFFVYAEDSETGEGDFLYAYDTYFDTEYDAATDTYYKSGDYWYGTYTPHGSKLEQIMTIDENGNKIDNWNALTEQQPWQAYWFTFENFNDQVYYWFKMQSGLYAVQAANDGINAGIVLSMYRLFDLIMPENEYRFPCVRTWEGKTETSSNISVNSWYTYYTITGGNKTTTSVKMTKKYTQYMTDENVILSGEYAGCRYVSPGYAWWAKNYLTFAGVGNAPLKIEGVASYERLESNKWYDLSSINYISYYKVEWSEGSKIWLIWDTDGNRVKVVEDADFQKILSDATAIDNPIEVPYSPYYYSLDGQVVENPTPGKIYIHNGKKVVYKK